MAESGKLGRDVRGVLIPMTDCKVLLPNACVSEVITYGRPQPIDGAPPWALGTIPWRGWAIPLFSFAQMIGKVSEEPLAGAKVPILKAFGGIHRMPYMALLAQGFPRLTAVTADKLVYPETQDLPPLGVRHVVQINDEEAYVPDLDAIERELLQVLDTAE